MDRASHRSGRRTGSGWSGLPSSMLGRRAIALMAGAIALVVVINLFGPERTVDETGWQRSPLIAAVVCLFASWVMAVVAVLRRHERSLLVLVPTALVSVVVVNELAQGVLQLLGHGG